MLTILLQIVSLQVVNDGKIVDVASARRNVTMWIALVLVAELLDQLLCFEEKGRQRLDQVFLQWKLLTDTSLAHSLFAFAIEKIMAAGFGN